MAPIILVLSSSFAAIAAFVVWLGFDASWGSVLLLYVSLSLLPALFAVAVSILHKSRRSAAARAADGYASGIVEGANSTGFPKTVVLRFPAANTVG